MPQAHKCNVIFFTQVQKVKSFLGTI